MIYTQNGETLFRIQVLTLEKDFQQLGHHQSN